MEIAEERRDRVMAVQQEIAFSLARRRIGERCRVLIDSGIACPDEGIGARSVAEAPDVDPIIRLVRAEGLSAGSFVEVEIVGADGYDCIAEVADDESTS